MAVSVVVFVLLAAEGLQSGWVIVERVELERVRRVSVSREERWE